MAYRCSLCASAVADGDICDCANHGARALFPDNFADHPPTLGDIRSDKTGDAKDWSVRDMLISTLQKIDRGEIKPIMGVLVFQNPRPPKRSDDSPTETLVRQAGTKTIYDTMGLLAWAQQIMGKEA